MTVEPGSAVPVIGSFPLIGSTTGAVGGVVSGFTEDLPLLLSLSFAHHKIPAAVNGTDNHAHGEPAPS